MRLTVLGCAGSFAGPDSACSAYLVEADGFQLLVDIGSGAFGALQRYADPERIDAVALSHLHLDHWADLSGMEVFRSYHPGGPLPELPVWGPGGLAGSIEQVLGPGAPFALRSLVGGEQQIGPFQVTAVRMNHPVQTFGLRLEHDGRVLAYSADTGPCDALVELARGADLLLCEASYVEAGDNAPDVHLTGGQAGEHATRSGVDRLLLTHLVSWNDVEQVRTEAAATFAGELAIARPGGVHEI